MAAHSRTHAQFEAIRMAFHFLFSRAMYGGLVLMISQIRNLTPFKKPHFVEVIEITPAQK
jgi:hypothetical protein